MKLILLMGLLGLFVQETESCFGGLGAFGGGGGGAAEAPIIINQSKKKKKKKAPIPMPMPYGPGAGFPGGFNGGFPGATECLGSAEDSGCQLPAEPK